MPSQSRAWVLDLGAGRHVSAGNHHVIEYLLSPAIIPVPLVPAHCAGLMVWRERLIPVIDLAPVLHVGETAAPGRRAVVLAYQEAPRQPLRHGALLVCAAPFEVWVSDDMACPLPETPEALEYIARSCFGYEGRAIPILDVARLFSRPLPWTAARQDDAQDAAVQPVAKTGSETSGHDFL